MSAPLPALHAVRHGETEWSRTGRHTGRSDLPLTPGGEENAGWLGARLAEHTFVRVWTSPLVRAARTCELAGFGGRAETDPDLVEWHYGEFEGITTKEILAKRPGWKLFRDGCPGGESPAEVAARADRVIARVRAVKGDVLLFSSGHFTRMLAARWLGRPPEAGGEFLLSTASLSVLAYDHDLTEPAIRLWNDTGHLRR
jgi:probable phosphoglycerate mutase